MSILSLPKRLAAFGMRNTAEAILYNAPACSVRTAMGQAESTVAVLLYHRVCEHSSEPFLTSSNISTISPKRLREHILYLKNAGFTFLTVGHIAEHLIKNHPLPKRAVCITFDDVFSDNIENAASILSSLDAAATFFVISSIVGASSLLWQHQLYWHLHRRGKNAAAQALASTKEPWLGKINNDPVKAFMRHCPVERKKVVLQSAFGLIPGESDIAQRIYPSAEQIANLSKSGFEIGSHGMGHHFMANLDDTEYLEELVGSRESLGAMCKQNIVSFSYPHNSYRDDAAMLQRAGYKAACTVDRGRVVAGDSPLRLKRINMPNFRLSGNALRRALYEGSTS